LFFLIKRDSLHKAASKCDSDSEDEAEDEEEVENLKNKLKE
jgi:hypothetical protein